MRQESTEEQQVDYKRERKLTKGVDTEEKEEARKLAEETPEADAGAD